MESPLIPPEEFVTRINAANPDLPYRTALDPLMMLLWHTVSAPPERDQAMIVTGC